MNSELRRELLADGLKWVVAPAILLVAVAVYVQQVYFELSVTGRAASFLVATLVCLVAAATWRWQAGPGLLAVLPFAMFLGYTALTHDASRNVGLAVLAGTLTLFLSAVYLIQERRLALTRRAGIVAAVVVLASLAGVVAVDFQPREITYEVMPRDSVDPVDDAEQAREVTIGSVTFTNDGPLREQVDFEARACVFTSTGERIERGVFFGSDSVFSQHSVGRQSSTTIDLTVALQPSELDGFDEGPVELASSCPESSDEQKVVVAVEHATGDPVNGDGGSG